MPVPPQPVSFLRSALPPSPLHGSSGDSWQHLVSARYATLWGGGGRTLTLPPLSRERWALVLGFEQVSVSQRVPAPSLLTTRRWLVDEK